jgi:hypothetical protein
MANSSWGERPSVHSAHILLIQVKKKINIFLKDFVISGLVSAKRNSTFKIQEFYILSTERISGFCRCVNLDSFYNVPEQHLASNQDGLLFLFGAT